MDPQKERVYEAEAAAFPTVRTRDGQGTTWHLGVDLPELADVRAFAAKVMRDRWFRRHFGWHAFKVKDGRGLSRAVANAEGSVISLSRRGRARWVVLHEIAHCLTGGLVQPHGPEFVRTYLRLVRHFLGRAAWRALHREMKQRKVRMQTRTKRPSTRTSEERARLAARLRQTIPSVPATPNQGIEGAA